MHSRWPDLEVLELLIAVGDHGGIGAAARAVGMAQPNASRALAALERSLGVRLLLRHPRGASLTDEGIALAETARGVLAAAEEFSAAAAAFNADAHTHLDVAASMTIAEHLLPKWLAAARRHHPGLDVRLRVCNSEDVFDHVASGRCPLGFVESPEIRRGLHAVDVARDTLTVVVAPGHPWAERTAPVTAEELAATPLVVREPGSGTRVTLDRALAGLSPARPAVELGSNAAVRAGVLAGAGPAVLSELAVAGPVAAGDLVAVPVSGVDLGRRLRAVWRGARPPASAAALLQIARG